MAFLIRTVSNTTGRYVSVEHDDTFSIALSAFAEAVGRYEPERGSFLPFAGLVIQSRLRTYMEREEVVSLDAMSEAGQEAAAPEAEEESDLHEEIVLLQSELSLFGLTLETLADEAPHHQDTRERALDIAERSSQDAPTVEETYRKRKLPVRRVARLCGATEKIVKGSLLIGYALIGGEEDPATLRSIQAFFSEQSVVCLSGAAGDIHAADGQSVSLGRYLIARMENEDLDEILEELPPETIGELLEETPAWSSHPEFQEALEEQLEKQTEDEEPDSGSEEPEEDPEQSEVPSEESEEDPERPERKEELEQSEVPPEEPEEDPEDASSGADGEVGQPDRSPTKQSEREDAPDEREQAPNPEDSGDPSESRPGEGPADGEEAEAPVDRNTLESGGAAEEDDPENGEQPEEKTDGPEPSESETNKEADTSGAETDGDAEPGE